MRLAYSVLNARYTVLAMRFLHVILLCDHPAPRRVNNYPHAYMSSQTIKTVQGWHYTLHATSACTLKQEIKGIPATLLVLPHGGAAAFTARSSKVIVETSGNFSLYPSKETSESIVVDQTYTPESANAQSGTAVAQAFSTGSMVESFPDTPPPYTLKQGATVQLSEYSDTLELLPSVLSTAQEMRLLYTPAEARTTPLTAVPDGVTLHWAGDAEPTWEAGKNYVIQLLQTAPTHIEARLFNAPQGAKLPDWLKTPYVVYKNLVAVAADFEGQTDGYRQFASDQASVKALAQELDKATFAEQLRGDGQFNGAIDTYLSLRNATFEKETTANEQFSNGASKEKTIYAPRATFGAVEVAGTFVGYMQNCYFPSATFKSLVSIEYFASASRGNHMFPSATFEKVESVNRLLMACIPFCYFYSLNFRKLSSVPNFVQSVLSTGAFNDRHREMFLSLVYGPRLDAEGNPTPVTKIDPATGDPTALEPEELTGTRRTDQSERPTGWGIQDFRVLNEDGTFALDSEGNYVYPDDVHNFKVPFYATARPVAEGGRAAYGEDIAQALSDLGERGWAVAYF